MKNILYIALLIIGALETKARIQSADQGVTWLKSFYSAYIPLFSGGGDNPEVNEKKLEALRRKYCTPACLKQYRKLIEETDADPIVKGQDSYKELIKTLVITKDSQKRNRYAVTYTDIQGTKEKTTIYVTLINQNGMLKIAYLE